MRFSCAPVSIKTVRVVSGKSSTTHLTVIVKGGVDAELPWVFTAMGITAAARESKGISRKVNEGRSGCEGEGMSDKNSRQIKSETSELEAKR
jgi:hypothetical protein